MTSPVTMRYSPPPEHLAERISSFYYLNQDCEEYDELERADRPQFRIMLSGHGHYYFDDGHRDPAWPVTLLGPTSSRVRGAGKGPVELIGAGLLPPAWVKLTGSAAESMVDCAIDASTLFGDCVFALRDTVAAEPDIEKRFALLSDFIEGITAGEDASSYWFTRIVDEWLMSAHDPQLETLTESCDLSVRQIERLCKRHYGLPPKTLARKYRALRAAAALARGDDLDAVGLGDTFYDQSHLIREIKRFAGLTPQQIRKQETNLLRHVSHGRKSLEGKVSPLISDA